MAEGSERLVAATLDVMFKFNDDSYLPPKRDLEDSDLQRLGLAASMVSLYGSQQLGSAAMDVLDAYEALRLSVGEGLKRRDELVHELADRGRRVTILTRRDLNLQPEIEGPSSIEAPELSRQALDRKVAAGAKKRQRFRRFRNANRVLFGSYTLYLLVRAWRRRRPHQ